MSESNVTVVLPTIVLPRARLEIDDLELDGARSPRREHRAEAIVLDALDFVPSEPLTSEQLLSLQGLETVFWKFQEGHPQFVSYLSEKEEIDEDNRVKAFTNTTKKMTGSGSSSSKVTGMDTLNTLTSLSPILNTNKTLQVSSSSHINLSQYDTEGVAERRLSGSPLYDILHMLVAVNATEEFNLNCIFCHRCFPSLGLIPQFTDPKARLTSLQFLELLLLRFLEPPEEAETEIKYHYRVNKTRIQAKIVRLLVTWVKCVPSDWFENQNALERHLIHFVANRIRDSEISTLQSVISFIEKKKLEERSLNPNRTTRRPKSNPDQSENILLDFWPESIAVEWSLIEAEIAKRVKPQHLLKTNWTKKEEVGNEQHPINHHLQWFNDSTKWIQFQVLKGETPTERAEIISHLIMVGIFLRAMNNFSGLMQIYSGLDSPAISRLKQSWDLVPEYLRKCHQSFGECMAPSQNYSRYRAAVHNALKSTQTAVPFFGMTLQDFTFFEEAPDSLESAECPVPVVNFAKMRNMSRELQKLFYGLYNRYDRVTNVLPELIKTHFGTIFEEYDVVQVGKLVFKKGILEGEPEELSMVSRSLPRRFLLESDQAFLPDLTNDSNLRLSFNREPSEQMNLGEKVEGDTSFGRRKHGVVSQLVKSVHEVESPRVYGATAEELAMDPRDWQLLRSISKIVEKKQGDVIIYEGQINDTVFLVHKGSLNVTIQTKGGPHLMKTLREGDCFGEMSMLNQFSTGVSSASVIVSSETCSIHVISRSLLDQLLESELSLSKHFWAMLAKNLVDRLDKHLNPNLSSSPKVEKKTKVAVLKTDSEMTFQFKNRPEERAIREQTINEYHSTSERGLIELFDLPEDTVIVKEYFCTLKVRFIKMPGSVSLTSDFICFYAKTLGGSKRKLIPFEIVSSIMLDSKKKKINITYGDEKKVLSFKFLNDDLSEAESVLKGLWINTKKDIKSYIPHKNERNLRVWTKAQTELNMLKKEVLSPTSRSSSKADSEIRILLESDWKILTDRRACLKQYSKGDKIEFESDLDMFQLAKGTCKIDHENGDLNSIIAPELFNETRFLISLFQLRTLEPTGTIVTAEQDVDILWLEYGFLKTLLVFDTTGLSGRFLKTLASILARRLRTLERLRFNH